MTESLPPTKSWFTNPILKRTSIPTHGSSVCTDLILDFSSPTKRIITASDDHTIEVHSHVEQESGYEWKHERTLEGHEGCVWTLAFDPESHWLVSGSTDKTIKVWDLEDGKCKHTLAGHTSTVRCIQLGLVESENGGKKEIFVVSGSRDHNIGIWKLPRREDEEYHASPEDGVEGETLKDNPFHVRTLVGHDHAIRDLAVHGRTAVSGSFDCTVRVWDIVTGKCRWVLERHSQQSLCRCSGLDSFTGLLCIYG